MNQTAQCHEPRVRLTPTEDQLIRLEDTSTRGSAAASGVWRRVMRWLGFHH